MSKELKRDSYIHISSFMVSELNLKGNELLVYAIIYGFCQDEESDFHGSLEYIQAWTNSSKQGVLNSIKSLLDKGFITKVKKGNFCYYKTNDSGVKKVDSESQESLPSGVKKVDSKGQKSLPNNIYILNNDNKFNINSSAPSSESLSTPFPEPEDYPIDTPKSKVAEVNEEVTEVPVSPKRNNYMKFKKNNTFLANYFSKITSEDKSTAETIVTIIENKVKTVSPKFYFSPNVKSNEEYEILEYARKNGVELNSILNVLNLALKDNWWGNKINSVKFLTNNYVKLAMKFTKSTSSPSKSTTQIDYQNQNYKEEF